MNKMPRTNALSSWTCLVLLTFILPVGAFELGNIFFTATAQAGQNLMTHLHISERPAESLIISCPGLDNKKVL